MKRSHKSYRRSSARRSRKRRSARRTARRSRRSREKLAASARRSKRRSKRRSSYKRRSREKMAASARRSKRRSRRSARRSARRVARRRSSARRSSARKMERVKGYMRRTPRRRRSRELTTTFGGGRSMFASARGRVARRSREGLRAGAGAGRFGRFIPRSGSPFRSRERAANPEASAPLRFLHDVVKPGAWAAGGVITTRVFANLSARALNRVVTTPGFAPWAPLITSTAGAGLVWWLSGRVRMLDPMHRRMINIGAGLQVVQEVLSLVLPRIGVGLQGGLLGDALYGGQLAGAPGQGQLGNCFTGACADAMAQYGWGPPASCGCGPHDGAIAGQGAAPGQDGMGNCFTGSCPGNPPGCIPGGCSQNTTPPPPPPPVEPEGAQPGATVGPDAGTAGRYAVQRAGIGDPMIQQMLVNGSRKAQAWLDSAGVN